MCIGIDKRRYSRGLYESQVYSVEALLRCPPSCTSMHTQSCPTPCSSVGSSRQEYWSGLPAPLQGIIPIQGSNPHLLHWQSDSLPLLLLLLSHFSRVQLCTTPYTAAHQAPCPWDFPGKNTGVGCHCLLHLYHWSLLNNKWGTMGQNSVSSSQSDMYHRSTVLRTLAASFKDHSSLSSLGSISPSSEQ